MPPYMKTGVSVSCVKVMPSLPLVRGTLAYRRMFWSTFPNRCPPCRDRSRQSWCGRQSRAEDSPAWDPCSKRDKVWITLTCLKKDSRTFIQHLTKFSYSLPYFFSKVPPYPHFYPYFSQTGCQLLLSWSIYLMKWYDRTLIPSHTFPKSSTVLSFLPILFLKVQLYSL